MKKNIKKKDTQQRISHEVMKKINELRLGTSESVSSVIGKALFGLRRNPQPFIRKEVNK